MTNLQYAFDIFIGFISYCILIFIFLNLWQYIYSDPNETAVPVYNEPTPVYEEPTTAHESAVQPVAAVPEYTDTSSEVTSLFSEQSGSDDETLLMAQQNEVAPDPIAEAPATYATSNADIQNQYVPESESTVIFNDDTLIAANQESAPESNNIADLGKLVYCRNCGQDMYEKAQKCDMCGHPNIWWGPDAKRTLTHKVSGAGSTDQKPAKEKFKLFGIFSVPALVCICLGIAFLAFLIVPSILGGKEEIKTNKDKTQTVEVDNGGGSNDEQTEQAEQSDSTTTSTTASESAATTTTTDPVEAETTEASDDNGAQQTAEADTEQTTANTTATTPATTTTTAATTTTATTTTATTTTKPNTTTTVATTTATQPSYYAPSATVKSQNKERDAIISAYETMAAEIGKMQLLVSTIEYEAIKRGNDIEAAGKSLYSYGIGADILKSIKNGKSGVTSAVTSAKPTTSELNAAYKSLQTLQSKYNAYYDYIVGATKFSNYVSKCSSYFNDFQSTASSSLALSKLNTSAQNTTDRDHYYADVLSEAFSAVDNAVSAYTTLYNKGKAVSSSAFDSEFPSMLASNASTYIKAAKYAQAVSSYCDILKSAPSAYSSAYKQLQKASEHLNNCTDLFVGAALDQSLESFKSNANTYINGASSASNTGKSYL